MNRGRLFGISGIRGNQKNGRLIAAAGAVALFAGASSLHAATFTWGGGTDSNWSTNPNWTPNGPLTASAVLTFNSTATTFTPNDDITTATFGALVFSSGAPSFTITSSGTNTNPILLNGGGSTVLDITNNSANLQTIDAPVSLVGNPNRTIDAAAGNLALYGVISNTNNSGVIFQGPFTTSLYAAETYTDSTTAANTQVTSGTLDIGTGGSIGSGGIILGSTANSTSAVLVLGDSNGTVSQTFTSMTTSGNATTSSIVGGNASNSTLTANIASSTVTFFGVIGGAGANQNNLTLVKSGAGTFVLHTNNTYTGGTVVQNGRFVSDAATAFPANTPLTLGDVGNDSATLDLYNTTVSVSNLTTLGTGALVIGTSNATATAKGTFNYNGGVNSSTFAGTIVNTLSITGALASTGVEVSSGTLALTNASNTYAAGTTLLGGTLIFSPGSIGTGPVFLDGGTLEYSASNTQDVSTAQTITLNVNGGTVNTNSNSVIFNSPIVPAVAANGAFTKAGAGTLTTNATNTYTKATNVTGGTLVIGSTGSIASTSVVVSPGAVMIVNGAISTSTALTANGTFTSNIPSMEISSLNGGGAVNLNATALQVDAGGSFGGVIGDASTGGSVSVAGGTLALSGANTYTGGTTVNAGILNVSNTSGSATGSGNVTLNGGTLASGVSGSVGGNVLAGTGAHTIAPGGVGTIGTLAVGGLTTSSQSTINFDLGTGAGPEITNGDLLTLGSGTVSIASDTPITLGGTPILGDDYRLIGGAISGINVANFSLPGAPAGETYKLDNNNVDPGYIDLEVLSSGPASLTWTNASANNLWDTGGSANWNNQTSTTVFHASDNVTFNDSNGGAPNYAVTLNSPVSPGSVTVNNSNGDYTIGGTGSIAGTGSLTKSGSGTLILATANTYSGGTTVTAGTLKIMPTSSTTSALPTGAVSITGGTLQLTSNVTAGSQASPTPASNVNITSLSISGNGTLDITNNHIIIDYTPGNDPISSIAAWITSAYAGNTWSGTGITSSTALANINTYGIGYADSADAGNPAGLASNQIEVMYTLLGDANLDGKVNGTDFTLMATNFNDAVTNGWDKGDFDYSSTVNGSDFLLLAGNFNQFASESSVAAADFDAVSSFNAANGIEFTSVPEPASIGLVAVGTLGLLKRRRKA